MDEILEKDELRNLTADLSKSPQRKFSKKIYFIAGVMFVLLLILVSGTFLIVKNRKDTKLASESFPSFKEKRVNESLRQWPNCSDIRGVIEEKDKLYVACLGGLLILDEKSGELSQLTTSNGINSSTLTSLIKDGDKLYIGSQNGVNIFDLKNNTNQSFTDKEGLLSVSNIELALDGDYLWIGSFRGLNRYNLKTKKMEAFTKELVDNSTLYNASELLVTPNAVYVIDVANAETPGGVARYDKATSTWERFGPSAFPKNPAETYYNRARIDLYTLTLVGDSVLVQDSGRGVWQAKDTKGSTWESVDGIANLLSGPNDYIYMFAGKSDKAYFIYTSDKDSKIYSYSPITKDFSEFASNDLFKNTNSNLFQKFISNGKLWFGSSSDVWLKSLEINSLKTNDFKMGNRPKSVANLVATINHKAIISDEKDLWQYNGKNFSKLLNFSDENFGGVSVFQPIYNTSKILVLSQSCGQGCSNAKVTIYDYKTKEKKVLDLNTKIDKMYEALTLRNYDVMGKRMIFNEGYQANKIVVVDLENFSVTHETTTVKGIEKNNQITCNYSYVYVDNRFQEISCPEKAENEDYAWSIGGNYNSSILLQTDKKTNSTTALNIDGSMSIPNSDVYIQQTNNFNIFSLRFINGNLWLATNKGLVVYSLISKSWKVINASNGLLSDEISEYIIDNNSLLVNSSWGGISLVPIQNNSEEN